MTETLYVPFDKIFSILKRLGISLAIASDVAEIDDWDDMYGFRGLSTDLHFAFQVPHNNFIFILARRTDSAAKHINIMRFEWFAQVFCIFLALEIYKCVPKYSFIKLSTDNKAGFSHVNQTTIFISTDRFILQFVYTAVGPTETDTAI